MPIFTVPNIERELEEFNLCHLPGGNPQGGQFCSAPDAGSGGGPSTGSAPKTVYQKLRARWAVVNNALLDLIKQPDSPEAKALVEEQKELVKTIYSLDVERSDRDISTPGVRDVVIVGAGPGGLSAAINAGAEGLNVVYIDAQPQAGGQPKFSSRIENYPGFEIGVSGPDLIADMVGQAKRAGADSVLGVRVEGLTHDDSTGVKTLTLSNGKTVKARAVIIATGVDARQITFPGSGSDSVFYQGQSPPVEVKDKPVVIVGGSNGAAQAALGAARTASQVTILARSGIKTMSDYQQRQLLNHPRITILQDEVAALRTDVLGRAQEVLTKGGQRIPARSLGLFLGGTSNTSWLPSTVKTEKGKVVVDIGMRTSVPGIYAIGDTRVGAGQRVVAAAGDAAIAVKDIFSYFDTQFPTGKRKT